MQVSNFEYTDQRFTFVLMFTTIAMFVVLMIVAFATAIVHPLIGFVVAAVISILYFWFRKNGIRKNGSAVIDSASTNFKLEDREVKVAYADITTYRVEKFNGPNLFVKFKDGSKFRLIANVNFSNYLYLEMVIDAFDKSVQAFRETHKAEIERKKSVFESKWMLPFLIVMTMIFIVVIGWSLADGTAIPLTSYTTGFILVLLWGRYVVTRRKK